MGDLVQVASDAPKLTEGALVLPPMPVPLVEGQPAPDARVALVNSEGRLLVFPAGEVPETVGATKLTDNNRLKATEAPSRKRAMSSPRGL